MRHQSGFTLIEVIITLSVGLLILIGILGIFLISRTALARNADRAEIAQNGRIAFERISRELRQAEELAVVIPEVQSEALSALEFQNGHDASALTYIRYYLEGGALYREYSYYTLPSNPSIRVRYNEVDDDGSPAVKTVLEDEIIAEYISAFQIYGNRPINLLLTLVKDTAATNMSTSIYGRNLH